MDRNEPPGGSDKEASLRVSGRGDNKAHDTLDRYGPTALITGAARAEGLGFAFARELAKRGLSLVLVDILEDELEARAEALRTRHDVDVRAVTLDLGEARVQETLASETQGLEVGLLVCNHMYTPTDTPMVLDMELETLHAMLDINARAYTTLTHMYGQKMRARRRGGILVISSGAGRVTTPYTGAYAANKAYQIALGEALWYELQEDGVDVLTVAAGLMRTQGDAFDKYPQWMISEPDDVVQEILEALGTRHMLVPGWASKLVMFYQTRVLSRQKAVASIGAFMRKGLGKS